MASTMIGVIAEDQSDVDVVNEILLKYAISNRFCVRKFIGNGCGRIKGKLSSWSKQLAASGCKFIIILHDLDRKKEDTLRSDLERMVPKELKKTCHICIPIEELEAWLLADCDALRAAFSLKVTPKRIKQCEAVKSPKEFLRDFIWTAGKKRYINTVHNVRIAKHSTLASLRQCNSFVQLDGFITQNIFKPGA